MSAPPKMLDELMRLRLAQITWEQFERFFLGYLNAGINLTVSRDGRAIKRRVVSAEMYAPGRGKKQHGIDLRLVMEGREVWVVQCKKVEKWSLSQTKKAIEEAKEFSANHYFLAVACDTSAPVHDEIARHPNWTLWNLDSICQNFRRQVPAAKRLEILSFLSREEVKRFLPFPTNALITPKTFFERYNGADKPLRHDWPMVGREEELNLLAGWAEGSQKVFLLSARGGEGKTRLVREFCARLASEKPGTEVLFLNPHREDNDFSLGLDPEAGLRVIVIDDAHRIDLVPDALLNLVRVDPKAKIVLASRPQGRESIAARLVEMGFGSESVSSKTLAPLKKPAARSLAQEVLGEEYKKQLDAFLQLTECNPFLITTAGGLLRQNRLQWGSWTTNQDFRRRVFEEFENENLDLALVPESERGPSRQLLRLLAILSPVAYTRDFVERAEALVKDGVSVERSMNFLRQVELVIGPDESLRVSPDLFADFLVYETCFDPARRERVWAHKVMEKYVDHGAVLLRNVSEARWIAHLNGVDDDNVLAPLMSWQREQFLRQSFIERQATLRHWTSFSQYLPRQTLEMAELAIEEKTAPADSSHLGMGHSFDNQEFLLKQVPALLRPVAKYSLEYSPRALDILWELGCRQPRAQNNNQNHPWTVISEVFKFEARKPLEYNEAALDWLKGLLRKPKTMVELSKPTPVLRLFLEPCFSRTMDGSYIEGRTIHFVEQEVRVSTTRSVRQQALDILGGLIERGPALVALDALSALETAIQRPEVQRRGAIQDLPKYLEQWRPERRKALALYQRVLEKYSDVVLRYEIRRTLKRIVIFEEDKVFAGDCREVLAKIHDDLPLRAALSVTPDFAYEFEDIFVEKEDPDRFTKSRERWSEFVQNTAAELAREFPEAESLARFLGGVVGEMTDGGYSLSQYPLLFHLGAGHPQLGVGLAQELLSAKVKTPLLQDWPALIDNDKVSHEQKAGLFEAAVRQKVQGAGLAVIRFLTSRAQRDRLVDERSQVLLFEIAQDPTDQEASGLFQLITYSSEANRSWTFHLLEKLTEKPIKQEQLSGCLTALAPIQGRATHPSADLVRHVFKQLVPLGELGFFEHGHVWQELKKRYPLEVYDLLCRRIEHAATDPGWEYTPVPHDLEGRLRLPELLKENKINSIVDGLWRRVTALKGDKYWRWLSLFQGIVFEDEALWRDRLTRKLAAARSEKVLLRLAHLIGFEGSLIIFSYPEITRSFLRKASELGGKKLVEEITSDLHRGAGPRARGYTNGKLDDDYDYVEAAALKAAEAHAQDEILGPFYRSIVEAEQKDRLFHKLRAEADMEG